jgi:Domain of unknown function (DUF5667)
MSEEIADLKTLEPSLQKMLIAYRIVPERDPESALRTRSKFLAELDMLFVEKTPLALGPIVLAEWIAGIMRLKDGLISLFGKRVIVYTVIAMVVFGVFLFGGAGITAYAASLSLPGDAIYPLKSTFENAHAALTADPAAKARLHLDFAARRLSEMQSLIDGGRYDDLTQTANQFERNIQMALAAVESLSQTDTARAAALTAEVAAILQGYGDILNQMLVEVPADVEPVIQYAINASESVTGDDSNGDDGGRSTPAPTATPLPEVFPTSTPAVMPTSGAPQPSPVPGGTEGGSGDDDNDDDDDDDDNDNDDDDDDDDSDGDD